MRMLFFNVIVGIFAILLSNDCELALQKHKEFDLRQFGYGNATLLLLIDKTAQKSDIKDSDIINYDKLKNLFGVEYLTKEIKIDNDNTLCAIATNFSKLELKIPPNEVKKSLIVDYDLVNNQYINTYEAVVLYNLFANHNVKFVKELLEVDFFDRFKDLGTKTRFDLYYFKKKSLGTDFVTFYKVEYGKQVSQYDAFANKDGFKYVDFYYTMLNNEKILAFDNNNIDSEVYLGYQSNAFIYNENIDVKFYEGCKDLKCQILTTKDLLDKCDASKLIIEGNNKYGKIVWQNASICGTEFVANTKYFDKENLKLDFMEWILNMLDFVKPILFYQD